MTDSCRNAVALLMNFVVDHQPWFYSIIASVAIGLSGVLPVFLVIPQGGGRTSSSKTTSTSKASGTSGGGELPTKSLRLLLSFAVGGLLGDVFLHLLPEAWNHLSKAAAEDESADRHRSSNHVTVGLWVLAGVFAFFVVELMFEKQKDTSSVSDASTSPVANGHGRFSNGKSPKSSNSKSVIRLRNGTVTSNGDVTTRHAKQNGHGHGDHQHKSKPEARNVTGYLNLLANGIDNFAHGLAVAGSFLVSFKVGLLTTFAILIHEIPHEIGDFAILLRSGFNRLEAVKAQMATATVGLAGAIAALSADSAQKLGERTAWILPFTAGGFLHIALVSVLPDIVQEKDPKESVKQIACLLAGIGVMATVTIVCG